MFFYCHHNNGRENEAVIHTDTIDTILNVNSGNNGHGVKKRYVQTDLYILYMYCCSIYENKGWVLCKNSVYICTHFIQNVFVDIGCKSFSYFDIDAAVEFVYFSRFSRFNFTVIF